jgi:hypothetical protein
MTDSTWFRFLTVPLRKQVRSSFFPPSIPGWGLLFLFLFLVSLTACAPRLQTGAPEIASYWTVFKRQQKTLKPLDNFSIKTSINYSSKEHKHRMIMRLFGRLDYPIRMDLEAGIGRTISMWREETDIWQAYFPGEKKMYTASDARFGVQSLGFPCPFSLRELSLVLQGKLVTILPDQPAREQLQDTGSRIFFAQPTRIESIHVDQLGRVLELIGSKGWKVVFDYQDASLYSYKISMIMDDTTRAIIRVKSTGPGHFTTDLAIELPDGTETINIDTFSPVRTNETNATTL